MKHAAVLSLWLACCWASTSYSASNPLKGEELFKQCTACHAVGEGAVNGVGPVLNHLFGRQAGADKDFQYSEAMKAKGETDNLLWDEKSLYIFLAGPERYIPGTIMAYPGLRTEKEIKDLLSYLIQYSPAYVPESGEAVTSDAVGASQLPVRIALAENEPMPEFSAEFMTSADAISNGAESWGKQCRHCHGSSAYPGKAPKLTPATYEPEFVFTRITDGYRKMPGWRSVFTFEERKNLVAYVLSKNFAP
ncbi:c-type cytochrome [Granulosicoccus sp.]|nr:c-type cytochrome [Granulosicoccus sp.]